MNNQWNLKNIFANDQEWELAIEKLTPLIEKIPSYKGRLNEKETFHEFML